MTTGQIDVKKIAKLPTVKAYRSATLSKRLVFRLFQGLRHGELIVHDGDEVHHFGSGDLTIAPSATVVIHNPRAYGRILTGGTVGAGEAYIEGDWSTEQLTEVTRVFSANMPILESMKSNQNWLIKVALKLTHAARKNSLTGSKENIAAHYDLGNDFFSLFLDPTLMYSSAVFPEGSDDLADASQHKLRLICEDLELKPTDHTTITDRIIAGTWAFAAAMTQGDITIHGGRADHMEVMLEKLTSAGAIVTSIHNGIRVQMNQRPKAIDVATLPYPGFATDLLPFIIAMNAVADGHSMVTENVFESRFMFVNELMRLGAQVTVDGHHASIDGITQLSGAPVEATDIRAGAGLVLAALVSEGETTVDGAFHIDRGYPNFAEDLRALGANVSRE